MRMLLGDDKRNILRADGLRHAIETMGEDLYLELLSADEAIRTSSTNVALPATSCLSEWRKSRHGSTLKTSSDDFSGETDGRFGIGDKVCVDDTYPLGHIRTLFYIRGKHGVIADFVGEYLNPELAAKGESGLPKQPLPGSIYRQMLGLLRGPRTDTLDVEIYEHWLAPAAGRIYGSPRPS